MKAEQGTLVTDATGNRRIRLGDAKKAARGPSNLPKVSLGDILLGTVTITGNDDTELHVKPLTLNGLALLNDLYKAEGGVEGISGREMTMEDYLRFATVLINQDRPLSERFTEAQIGDKIDAENMAIITAAVMEAVRPLLASLGPTEAQANPLTGANSPTGALASSAGTVNS